MYMKFFYWLHKGQGLKALVVLMLMGFLNAQAQFKPNEITLAGEKYYEYPFRVDGWAQDIPPCGYNLPNGKYLAFINYRFKVINKKGDRKLIAKDTNIIRALFVLENNKPVGDVFFYNNNLRPPASKKKLAGWYASGKFSDGLKDGEWIEKVKGKIFYEHYKNGLKHGLFTTWAPNNKTYNTCYIEGREVGYVNSYDAKGKLQFRYYNDTLQVRDSSIHYNKGKLYNVYDVLVDPPNRTKEGIWKEVLMNERIVSDRRSSAFTTYKKFNDDGSLSAYVQLKNPDSYYFDSLLSNNCRITITQVGCPGGDINDTCYEVRKQSIYTKNTSLDYYRNLKNYKSVNITLKDTITELTLDPDTMRKWQFQPTEIISGRTFTYTTYELPALNYSYVKEEDNGKTRIIPYNSFYAWERIYGFKITNKKQDNSGPYLIPTTIDSAGQRITFADTTTDPKLGITLVSGVEIKPYPIEFLSRNKYDRAGMQEWLLKDEIHDPMSELYVPNSYGDLYSEHIQHIRFNDNGEYTQYASEKIIKNNTPYTGAAHLRKRKKNGYDVDKNLLTIAWPNINYDYGYNTKGAYKDGLKEGAWEFIIDKRASYGADFKKLFFEKKSLDFYNVVNYSKGKMNGVSQFYEEFTPQIWDEGYFQLGGKSVKYLSSTMNYTDGHLEGPAVFYHPNGKTQCTVTYKNDELDGEVLKYNFSGIVIYKAQFKMGMLNGPLTTYDYTSLKPEVKANFSMNRLDGLLEMFNQDDKWIEVKADTGYMHYKKLYYEKNILKEEIVLGVGAVYKLMPFMLQSQNFLSYCPGIPNKKRHNGVFSSIQVASAYDSARYAGFFGHYKSYYNTGQLYSQGRVEKMRPAGTWEFYDIGGTVTNRIDFKDSIFTFADTSQKQGIIGKLTGYYGDGRIRCVAFVTSLDVSYDCNTHADKSAFELILKDNYDYYGKDNCKNGYGVVKQYTESGVLEAQGRIENYMKTGLWKYYDPNGKLNKMGTYTNNLQDGTWLEGDLEGLNYEDAACFDRNNEDDMKKYLENQKKLEMKKSIYKKGELLRTQNFYVNMNRE